MGRRAVMWKTRANFIGLVAARIGQEYRQSFFG